MTKPPDVTRAREGHREARARGKDAAVHSQDFELAAKLRDQLERLKREEGRDPFDVRSPRRRSTAWSTARRMADDRRDDGHPGLEAEGGGHGKLLRMEEALHERVIGQDAADRRVPKRSAALARG